MSVDEIYQKIVDGIQMNEYEWQEKNMIRFRGSNRAEYLDIFLVVCLRCKSLCSMYSKKNTFKCIKCGHKSNADINAARNIAILGIEQVIDEQLKEVFGEQIFGCDICQNVCPYNKDVLPNCDAELENEILFQYLKSGNIPHSSNNYKKVFGGTPLMRTAYKKFLSNLS